MKKVLIIGANGKVGRLITQKMKASEEFSPTAFIRKEEQKSYFDELGVESVISSLEDSVDSISEAIKGKDAVIFSAGSGGKTGADKTLSVDLDGAIKSMDAAKKVGVNRFVMVSAMKADDPEIWEKLDGMKPYYIAKHYADRFLKSSGLEYTILRPGMLLDEEGQGKIDTKDPASKKGVPRADVASVAIAALKTDESINKIIEFNSGEEQIDTVFEE